MEKKRIKELDFFRGLAALFIVLYHYTTRYNISFGHLKQPYYLDIKYGSMAVAVFFILSGFLITLGLNKHQKPNEFFLKRLVRLYPSYVAGMMLTTIVLLTFGGEAFQSRLCSPIQWLMNLTMLPLFIGGKVVDGVYWTLKVEIIFYFLMSVIIFLKKEDKLQNICLGWIILSIMINILSHFFHNIILSGVSILSISQNSSMLIIGILMCLLYKGEKNILIYFTFILCLINQFIAEGIAYTLFLFIFSIVFYCIIVKKVEIPNYLNNKFIIFLSKISYPLYLIHQFIGFVIIYRMEEIGLINEFFIIIPIGISILLAYLIHITIENRESIVAVHTHTHTHTHTDLLEKSNLLQRRNKLNDILEGMNQISVALCF